MSETETKENPSETKPDTVETNVALTIAERDSYKALSEDLAEQLDAMTKKYEQAKALIEEDSKAALIKEIAPYCSVPAGDLALKTVDELEQWKRVLNYAKQPAFKAGTPLKPVDRSPEAKLASAYDDYADKTWRKS